MTEFILLWYVYFGELINSLNTLWYYPCPWKKNRFPSCDPSSLAGLFSCKQLSPFQCCSEEVADYLAR